MTYNDTLFIKFKNKVIIDWAYINSFRTSFLKNKGMKTEKFKIRITSGEIR